MSYQDDKYHRQAQADAWEHLLGYDVLDQQGDKIGTVKALWEDYTRQPAYLGVATSWLDMGRIHLVPAQFATLSERKRCVRLSFPADVVKGAPECHATDEITLSGETKIRDYYYRKGIWTGRGRVSDESRDVHAREDRSTRSEDWSVRERRNESEDSRSFKDRIRDAVDEGKAKLSPERKPDRPEELDRAEREMGLPFEQENSTELRKIYHETPVAKPVRPVDEDAPPRYRDQVGKPREESDFTPLRRDPPEAERRLQEDDRDDMPLR